MIKGAPELFEGATRRTWRGWSTKWSTCAAYRGSGNTRWCRRHRRLHPVLQIRRRKMRRVNPTPRSRPSYRITDSFPAITSKKNDANWVWLQKNKAMREDTYKEDPLDDLTNTTPPPPPPPPPSPPPNTKKTLAELATSGKRRLKNSHSVAPHSVRALVSQVPSPQAGRQSDKNSLLGRCAHSYSMAVSANWACFIV